MTAVLSLSVCERGYGGRAPRGAAAGWFARRIKQPAFIILQRTGTLIKIVTKNYYFFEMQRRSGDDAITFIMPREWCCRIEKTRELCVCVYVWEQLTAPRQGKLLLNFNFQETSYRQRIFCITGFPLLWSGHSAGELTPPERLYSLEK
jgi:hypothetical protein